MGVEQMREEVRVRGLFARDRSVLIMLSGGRDSTCLLDIAVALLGARAVGALHVNYGLRAQADEDERQCAALCEQLGAGLEVVRAQAEEAPSLPGEEAGEGSQAGNLHAWARELRYARAHELAQQRDALIATGHTSSDQVETILYRLAASPGRRALLGMPTGEGRLIRPLLTLSREQTAAYCLERGLRWREDDSNDDRRFARARVRGALVPALRTIHPAAEANLLRTAALLREETELLDGLVEAELAGRGAIALARLRELPAALARMVVVRLAEDATGAFVPQAGDRVQEILALAARTPGDAVGGRAELHVGGQAGAIIDHGELRMVRLPPRET